MALLSKYLSRSRFNIISPYVRGDVLDVGCQTGELRQSLRSQIDSYVGIDISAEEIERARVNHPDCEFHVMDLDEEDLDFVEAFDTIVLSAVIEHVFNLKRLGRGLSAALKPGGQVIITSPTNFGNDIVHRVGSSLGLFSKVARDDHIAILNRKRFEILAGEVDLRVGEYRTFQLGCNQLVIYVKPY